MPTNDRFRLRDAKVKLTNVYVTKNEFHSVFFETSLESAMLSHDSLESAMLSDVVASGAGTACLELCQGWAVPSLVPLGVPGALGAGQ
jgi:hypothetical protein